MGKPRGIGTIDVRPRADGTNAYRVRWTDGAGRHTRTFATDLEARAFLLTVERDRARGTYRPPVRVTVAEAVRSYLHRSRHRLAPATLAVHTRKAEAHILPDLGGRPLESLTVPQVQRWIDSLADRFAPGTVRTITAVLSGALAEAVRMGLIDHNPVQGTRLPMRRRSVPATWGVVEVRRVLDALRGEPFWYALYLTAITSGLRPGELRALQWDCVDFEANTLRVRRTVTRDEAEQVVVQEGTKTHRIRTVSLPAATMAGLARLPRTSPFVFPSSGGGVLWDSTWHTYHTRLCERAGVRRITLHQLRHTSATLALHLRVHPRIVSERLGHSTVAMTLDVYTGSVPDLHRLAAEELGELLQHEAASEADRG